MAFLSKHAALQSSEGKAVLLKGITASADLRGMLLEMQIEQRFRNTGATNLEVVYTFPLPWRAVLLDVDVTLGARMLTGIVVAKEEAVQGYEDALAEGDAAVMLEVNPDRSYSLNLGNLASGEDCVITLRYAQLLQIEQGKLRLLIPTVIAPRYGDQTLSLLQPHQTPTSDMGASYRFDLTVRLHGDLSRGPVGSPTHPIRVDATTGLLTVTLAARAMLDRDFVLVLDHVANVSSVLCAPDSQQPEHHVVMASFCPLLPPRQSNSVNAAILVDCSGSMAGDSISAAQSALNEILDHMAPGDRFSLSRFGSRVEHRSRGMWPLNGATLASARQWAHRLAADLGGTEMEQALASTFALASGSGVDVLLITDGLITSIESTLEASRRSGHRLFIVGIGTSVAEAHLRRLAEETDGACEFLAPGEAAAPAIVKMFARMRSPGASALRVTWPGDEAPLWSTSLPAKAFEGDTLHVFALLRSRPVDAVILSGTVARSAAMLEIARAMPNEDAPQLRTLPRVAAATRIQTSTESDRTHSTAALAVAYQLVTPETSFLLVHERASVDKASEMPAIHQVAQMMPAGWGGIGSVRSVIQRADNTSQRYVAPPDGFHSLSAPSVWRSTRPLGSAAPFELPSFLRKAGSANAVPMLSAKLPLFDICNREHWNSTSGDEGFTLLGFEAWLAEQPSPEWPKSYADLEHVGISNRVMEWLRRHIGSQRDERLVVTAFCTIFTRASALFFSPTAATFDNIPDGAAMKEAMEAIRIAISISGEERWPVDCLSGVFSYLR